MGISDPQDRVLGSVTSSNRGAAKAGKAFDPDVDAYSVTPTHGYGLAARHRYPTGGEAATRRILSYTQYLRPWIGDEDGAFVWPGGLENFRYEGSATIGVHKYLGTSDVDATVQHYDEPHITISGVLEGTTDTMVNNMVALRQQCVRKADGAGKMLFVPGWERIRYVVVENYSFEYSPDNRGGGIAYSISCLITGVGAKVGGQDTKEPINNYGPGKHKGKTHLTYTVNAKHRTLREIARVVYKNGDKWKQLYDLNHNEPWMKAWRPGKQLPLHWPAGSNKPVKVKYR